MSIKCNCHYFDYSHKFLRSYDFMFEADATGSDMISRVDMEYYGYNSRRIAVSDQKTIYPIGIGRTCFRHLWRVREAPFDINFLIGGYVKMTVYDKSGRKAATDEFRWPYSGNDVLRVWGGYELYRANFNHDKHVIINAFGFSNLKQIHHMRIDWKGCTHYGVPISGHRDFYYPNHEFMREEDIITNCSVYFPGEATITVWAGCFTKTTTISWPEEDQEVNPPPPEVVLEIESLEIDKNKTTGMKDGKYVPGTKLAIKAQVRSNNGLKKARMVLTGAKNSDSEWSQCSTTIEATTTASEVGDLNIKLIVTDKKDNTAEKTITVKIDGDDDKKYFAYYFFGSDMYDSLIREDLNRASIKLYNKYNEDNKQVDPAGLTFTLYGHYYETYNQCKDVKQDISNLLEIKTFKAPDDKQSEYIEIPLTDVDIAKLRNCKGLAFGIVEQKMLTIHGAQVAIDVEYKS